MSEDDEDKCVRGKCIDNNGILVLKDLTEEDIDGIESIDNNGILIVPKKLVSKLSSRGIDNNGIIVPYEEGMRVYAGSTNLDAATLNAFDAPTDILQAGKLQFKDDITPELVTGKIRIIKNYGLIIVPENIYGTVMAKVTENFGKVSKPSENYDHKHHHKHSPGCDHDDD
jgi:hypothetical protein